MRQGKYKESLEALEACLQAVKEPVPKATGLLARGEARLGQGEFDKAQQSVNDALLLQPEGRLNAEGRTLSGQIAMARGDYEGAAKIFLSVAVVYDDAVVTPRALEQAHEAYAKAGNEEEAAKVLNELQTRYPEYQIKSATAQ
jgi:TolA-binding protein